MPTTTPSGYYNRFDPEKNYEKHLFRAGFVLQSAEMNEIQESGIHRAKSIGDALFKDGDVVRDAKVIVDSETGETICEAGAVYLNGAVRGVPPGNITIPVVGTVAIGIWLVETVVDKEIDPDLRDPAAETRNYQEPGASRLMIEPQWGYDSETVANATFYPIYYADDGQLRAKEAPPSLDSVNQAIARYDRDSAGSNYVVSGMRVEQLDDLMDGTQVYNILEGRARVNGFGVEMSTSRRVEYDGEPEFRLINGEIHSSTGPATQRVDLYRPPIESIVEVKITTEVELEAFNRSLINDYDPFPAEVVAAVSIQEIRSLPSGGTVYTQGTDYRLASNRIEWVWVGQPGGAIRPSAGSTYYVTYRHRTAVSPESPDDTGFSVTGSVASTDIEVKYYSRLPRVDRLCMNDSGEIVWIRGVSADSNPVPPPVPNNMIALAQVIQTWDANRQVINDGVRVVPMAELEAMNQRLDTITDLIAQQKLAGDINQRDSAAKKGLFVDPFLDDLQRDQGIAQTAAIIDGVLTLPVDGEAARPNNDISVPATCAFTLETALAQNARTGSMKINPYMSFGILPASATLNPAVDRWVTVQTSFPSLLTRLFYAIHGLTPPLRKTITLASTLRPIEVKFTLKGFVPGETLSTVTFDGIPVTPSAL